MSHTNITEHYELSQFLATDKPAWLTDYNLDMQKIDTVMHDEQVQITENLEAFTETKNDFEERITSNDEDITTLQDRATSLEDRMTSAEGRLDVDESNIETLTNRAGVAEHRLDVIESGAYLTDKCVKTRMLDDRCVTNDKIARNAVTTDEILDHTIQYEDLSEDCINHFDPKNNNTYLKLVVDALYPVGSIYLSMGVNPNQIFAGTTWVRVNGGVLYTSANSGEEGAVTGNDTITLNTNQIPQHRHTVTPTGSISGTITSSVDGGGGGGGNVYIGGVGQARGYTFGHLGEGTDFYALISSSSGSYPLYVEGGGGVAHSHTVNLSNGNLNLNTVYTTYVGSGNSIDIKQQGVHVGVWKRTV